jgi:hypothetical protein
MGHRLKLEEVACEIAPARTRARVQLRNAGLEHVGLASSRPDEENWPQAVAQATLNAVRMYAGFAGADMQLALDAVNVVSDPNPVVLVSITAGLEGHELSLLGSALLRDDPQRAVAKAVLQALNRQIERLTPLRSGEAG